MNVYVTYDVTTYGLRRGILKNETIIPHGGYVSFDGKIAEWFKGKYIFSRYGCAIKNAEKQRAEKIAQLEKQIERIKRIIFK